MTPALARRLRAAGPTALTYYFRSRTPKFDNMVYDFLHATSTARVANRNHTTWKRRRPGTSKKKPEYSM